MALPPKWYQVRNAKSQRSEQDILTRIQVLSSCICFTWLSSVWLRSRCHRRCCRVRELRQYIQAHGCRNGSCRLGLHWRRLHRCRSRRTFWRLPWAEEDNTYRRSDLHSRRWSTDRRSSAFLSLCWTRDRGCGSWVPSHDCPSLPSRACPPFD